MRAVFKSGTVVLALAMAGLVACSKQDGQGGHGGMAGMPPPQVTVLNVAPQDVATSYEYVGQTAGSREVEVRARVAGILEKRLFEEGGPVRAGQALFMIDPKPIEAQVAAAEAEVATLQARLAQAKREAARVKPLAAEKVISQKEYDDAASAEQIADAGLLAAQAKLRELRLNLGYTKVEAPVSGVSGRAIKSEGSLVQPGGDSLLTTILQIDPLYVTFSVSEDERARFERDVSSGALKLADSKLALTVLSNDGQVLAKSGRVNFVASNVSGQTGTVEMRGEVPNPGGKLRAGQFVKVRLEGATRPNALVVPQRAVLDMPQGKLVMLVGKGKDGSPVVEPRPVQVGDWVSLPGDGPQSKGWVITGGLQPGDQVILDNFPKLRPGAPVTVGAPPAQSAPAAAQSAPAQR